MDMGDSNLSTSQPMQSRNNADKNTPSRSEELILNASSATQPAQSLDLLLAGPLQKDLVPVFRNPTAARSQRSDYPESGNINSVMGWCDKKLSESPAAAESTTQL